MTIALMDCTPFTVIMLCAPFMAHAGRGPVDQEAVRRPMEQKNNNDTARPTDLLAAAAAAKKASDQAAIHYMTSIKRECVPSIPAEIDTQETSVQLTIINSILKSMDDDHDDDESYFTQITKIPAPAGVPRSPEKRLAMEPKINLFAKTAASIEQQRLNPPPPTRTLWNRRTQAMQEITTMPVDFKAFAEPLPADKLSQKTLPQPLRHFQAASEKSNSAENFLLAFLKTPNGKSEI